MRKQRILRQSHGLIMGTNWDSNTPDYQMFVVDVVRQIPITVPVREIPSEEFIETFWLMGVLIQEHYDQFYERTDDWTPLVDSQL